VFLFYFIRKILERKPKLSTILIRKSTRKKPSTRNSINLKKPTMVEKTSNTTTTIIKEVTNVNTSLKHTTMLLNGKNLLTNLESTMNDQYALVTNGMKTKINGIEEF
jgi:hypothetical protein